MRGPWQALIGEGRIGGHELGIAVGRQINRSECLVVQGIREGQRDGDDCIIPMIAGVRGARHDTAADLSDCILHDARCGRRRVSRRRAGCGRRGWGRASCRRSAQLSIGVGILLRCAVDGVAPVHP